MDLMKFFYAFLLMIVTHPAFCQMSKAFVDKQGSYTNDSTGSIGYILVQKIQDSSYQVKLYSFQNNLAMQGYYKDSLLNVPNGEFIYYNKPYVPAKFANSTFDTSSYITRTGKYLNGLKSGLWTVYSYRNIKDFTCVFNKGKLNGLYQKFSKYQNNYIAQEGNYIDNMQEGEWKDYDTAKNTLTSYIYKHDTLINTIYHNRAIRAPAKFDSTMTAELHGILNSYRTLQLKISFTVDTDGTVGNVQGQDYIPAKKVQIITAAILKAGKFKPALYNDKPYMDTYVYTIRRILTKEDIDDIQASHVTDIYSRHANDIGRGLNRQGIGKPIKDDD